MKERYLDQQLTAYSESDYYPFHMPGHKRRSLNLPPAEFLDITEIEGFDNLHHAEGILAQAQARMAAQFGADHSFFLINGSTAGLLSAICAAVPKRSRILVARNCHKAVYHGIFLRELTPVYLYPEQTSYGIQGSISPASVQDALKKYPDMRAVIITSPTYDGVVSDIASISQIVHSAGIPLIVDEAHGAHFGFSPDLPPKALSLGADLVIESMHKTLPALTQTAALHVNGSRVSLDLIQKYLGIFQTSSPSYLFMAGLDQCSRFLKTEGEKAFDAFVRRLKDFYAQTAELKRLHVLPAFPFCETHLQNRQSSGSLTTGIWQRDPTKLLISAATLSVSGQALADLLRCRYHLEMEMASGHYVTALTSVCDTAEGFSRLLFALQELDHTLSVQASHPFLFSDQDLYQKNQRKMELWEAQEVPCTRVPLQQAASHISGEFICLYPPGIPLIVPGEVLSASLIDKLTVLSRAGYEIQGMSDFSGKTINIVI